MPSPPSGFQTVRHSSTMWSLSLSRLSKSTTLQFVLQPQEKPQTTASPQLWAQATTSRALTGGYSFQMMTSLSRSRALFSRYPRQS